MNDVLEIRIIAEHEGKTLIAGNAFALEELDKYRGDRHHHVWSEVCRLRKLIEDRKNPPKP